MQQVHQCHLTFGRKVKQQPIVPVATKSHDSLHHFSNSHGEGQRNMKEVGTPYREGRGPPFDGRKTNNLAGRQLAKKPFRIESPWIEYCPRSRLGRPART